MLLNFLKALHIVFVVAWFAGLFYLPRLFIYHLGVSDSAGHARFCVMERRLLAITHIGGSLALLFGIALLLSWKSLSPDYLRQGWLHAKLGLVLLLVAYHLWLMRLVARFAAQANRHSERWLRWFNEVPTLLLIAIVVLVVVKPF